MGPGTVLSGTYRIESKLGAGGMGTVWRAQHLRLPTLVAVKVLNHRGAKQGMRCNRQGRRGQFARVPMTGREKIRLDLRNGKIKGG